MVRWTLISAYGNSGGRTLLELSPDGELIGDLVCSPRYWCPPSSRIYQNTSSWRISGSWQPFAPDKNAYGAHARTGHSIRAVPSEIEKVAIQAMGAYLSARSDGG